MLKVHKQKNALSPPKLAARKDDFSSLGSRVTKALEQPNNRNGFVTASSNK